MAGPELSRQHAFSLKSRFEAECMFSVESLRGVTLMSLGKGGSKQSAASNFECRLSASGSATCAHAAKSVDQAPRRSSRQHAGNRTRSSSPGSTFGPRQHAAGPP